MEWTTILRYEFVQEVQQAMDFLVQGLPMWQALHGPAEVCWTWDEYVKGAWYVVNLCVNTLEAAQGPI